MGNFMTCVCGEATVRESVNRRQQSLRSFSKEPHRTSAKFCRGGMISILTTIIVVIMGRRLPDEVVHRIRFKRLRLCIRAMGEKS